MAKTKSLLILIFSFLFLNHPFSSFTEDLTITTYYPSPIGVYKELRAKRIAIGENYYNPSDYCWMGACSFSVNKDADLIVEGKVGIGTENPQEELHVVGDAVIENGGLVVGNPTGGNKGTGTINAEKIYVNGGRLGGGRFSECEIVMCSCYSSSCDWGNCSCTATCPADKWLVSGGISQPYVDSCYGGNIKSCPKTFGKGGGWQVEGVAYCSGAGSPLIGYALCCK